MSWQEYCNQASLAVSQGNYAEAERFIYEAFKEARQEKNLERIYTALDLLGWLAFMQTKYDDAEKIYQYVAKVKVQLFGADHVEIAKTLKNLIAAAYQVKQYERVVPYAKEASRIFAANLGAAHPECQAIAGNLFELLKWLNRPGEAEEVRISYLAPPPPPPAAPPAQFGQQTTSSGSQPQTQAYSTEQYNTGQQATAQNTASGGYNQAQQQAYAQQQAQAQAQAQAQQGQSSQGTGTGQYSNLGAQQQQAQQQQPNYGTGTGQHTDLAQQQQAQQQQAQQQQAQQQQAQQQQAQQQQAQQQQAQQQQGQQAAYGTGTGQYSNLAAQQQGGQPGQAQYGHQTYQPQGAQAQPQGAQALPIAPTQAPQPAGSKSDYSKYAKNICEVCQYEYDGPECLRCTSGQLTVFDPNSRLNW